MMIKYLRFEVLQNIIYFLRFEVLMTKYLRFEALEIIKVFEILQH